METQGTSAPAAFRDELTGLYNRRFWTQQFPHYAAWATQHNSPLSLVVMRVHGLREINNARGYHDGNKVLAQVATILRDYQGEAAIPKEYRLPIRYSGDCFCLLLPGVPRRRAQQFIEALLRAEVQNVGDVSFSVGLAATPEDAAEPTPLMSLAEKAADASRELGSNRVCTPTDATRLALDEDHLHMLFPCRQFVGRVEQLERVRALLNPDEAARPLLVINGVLGSGKSRFLEEVYLLAQSPRHRVLWCRCLPFLLHQPFGVLLEALQHLGARDPGLRDGLLTELPPAPRAALRQMFPDWTRGSVLDEGADMRLPADPAELVEDAFVAMLLAIPAKVGRMLVVLVDDAHWIDTRTLRVLSKLMAHPEHHRLQVVMAIRSDDERARDNEALQAVLVNLYDAGASEFLELTPFAPAEIGDLLGRVLSGVKIPEAVLSAIHARSQGLPALVEEMVRIMVRQKLLVPDAGGVNVAPLDNLPALQARDARSLDETLLHVLTRAAVIGPVFSPHLLHALEPGRDIGKLLERAVELGLLVREGERYRFASTESFDSFGTMLPEAEARRSHAQIAVLLEEATGAEVDVARLAFHWHAAGFPDRAEMLLQSSTPARVEPAPPPVTPPPLPATVLPEAVKLLRALKAAAWNYRAFPPHSEIVQEALRQLLDDLTRLHEHAPLVSFTVAEGTVLANGQLLPEKIRTGSKVSELAAFLTHLGLWGLELRRGLRAEELSSLLEAMSLPQEEIAQLGGWRVIAGQLRLRNVVVVENPEQVVDHSRRTGRARTGAEAAARLQKVLQVLTDNLPELATRPMREARLARVLALEQRLSSTCEDLIQALSVEDQEP
ncbi:MAG: diguanylate cyclase domain-containing protein [Candidatus Xenobia bacterium]